ncbi:O-antigen ligase family protein [bacterium]|nr:O-antigen ligase family protein [bacterium]
MAGASSKAARKGGRTEAAASAAPSLLSSGPEAHPALALCCTLGLLVLFLLPLFGGGYSGAGFQLSFVALPLALAAGLWVSRALPRAAAYVLLLYLAGLGLLPLWLAPGQLLWYYIAQIPLAWAWAWILLSDSPSRARWLAPTAALSALLTALYGFFLWYGAGTLDYQITSSFGLHNPYGGYLLLAWPCALLAAHGASRRPARIAWSLLAVLLLATLVLTHSQGCIAALGLQLIMLLAWWLASRRRPQAESAAAARKPIALALPLSALAVLAGLLALAPVRDTLAQIFDFGGYSMQGRLRFWSAALEIFRDYPLGAGPGSFAYVFPQYQKDWIYYSVDPHSWVLQLLAELGIPGALLLLAISAGMLWWLHRMWHGQGPWLLRALCASAVLGSLAHASIDFDYTFSAVTMLLGALLAYGSFIASGRLDSQPAEDRPAEPAAQPAAAQTDAPASAAQDAVAVASPRLAAYFSSALPRWCALACILLLLGMAYWGQRLSLERFVLDTLRGMRIGEGGDSAEAAAAAGREQLLRSAIRYNPHNFQTRYQLAYPLALSTSPASRDEARALAQSAVSLNPRFTQAWALMGLIATEQEDRESNLARAIELDPYNFPEHYLYWANVADTDEERRERLLLGMQRIPANDPIPPDHVRPQWHALNPYFGQWWDMLAGLTEDPAEKRLYTERAQKFKDYVIAEREKKLQREQ